MTSFTCELLHEGEERERVLAEYCQEKDFPFQFRDFLLEHRLPLIGFWRNKREIAFFYPLLPLHLLQNGLNINKVLDFLIKIH